LGIILDNLRIYPQAKKELEYSIKASGGAAVMHSIYGDILVRQERFDEATLHFKAALLKDSDYEPARKSYAELLEFLGQDSSREDGSPSI